MRAPYVTSKNPGWPKMSMLSFDCSSISARSLCNWPTCVPPWCSISSMADAEMPVSLDLSTQLQATMGALVPMLLQQRTPSGKDRLGEKRQRTEPQEEQRQPELHKIRRTVIQLLLKREDQLQSINKPHPEKLASNQPC